MPHMKYDEVLVSLIDRPLSLPLVDLFSVAPLVPMHRVGPPPGLHRYMDIEPLSRPRIRVDKPFPDERWLIVRSSLIRFGRLGRLGFVQILFPAAASATKKRAHEHHRYRRKHSHVPS